MILPHVPRVLAAMDCFLDCPIAFFPRAEVFLCLVIRASMAPVNRPAAPHVLCVADSGRCYFMGRGAGLARAGPQRLRTGSGAGLLRRSSSMIPMTSRTRQREQPAALVAGRGRIVAEFFDIGQSRTLAWSRRLKRPARGRRMTEEETWTS